MNCPQCHTTVSDTANFCPVCGMTFEQKNEEKIKAPITEGMEAPVREKKCKACAAPIAPDAKFCAVCGADQTQEKLCAYCHAPLENNSRFCTVCGNSTQAPKNPMENTYAARTLTFGIMGLAFSLSFFFSVLGIIFSAIAKVNLKKYLTYTPKIRDGRAGAGNGLAIAGLAVGITYTAIIAHVLLTVFLSAL